MTEEEAEQAAEGVTQLDVSKQTALEAHISDFFARAKRGRFWMPASWTKIPFKLLVAMTSLSGEELSLF